jgi:hypothetical protein
MISYMNHPMMEAACKQPVHDRKEQAACSGSWTTDCNGGSVVYDFDHQRREALALSPR